MCWPVQVYDLAGNQTTIGGYSSVYDTEGKLKTSTPNSIVTTMAYDGEGRRVKMVTGSRTTVFVYGEGGKLAEELDTTMPAESGVRYLGVDHLGRTRMAFDGAGAATKFPDCSPDGEQTGPGVNGRSGACWGG
ncbi:MAG: RHS repeat protein [Acidobacteria bacterium]|nr:RHS repeat protein [Acidobacteriota bacterium]